MSTKICFSAAEKKERIKAYKKKYAIENKERIAAYKKKYAEENKEKIAIAKKEYRQKNKEKIKERDSLYYKKNKERMLVQFKEYREKNKEHLVEYKKQWYKNNKTELDEKTRRYYEKNKIVVLEWHKQWNKNYIKTENGKKAKTKARHKRRTLKYQGTYEIFDSTEIFERDGYRCQCCHKKTRPDYKNYNHPLYPNLDHIVPLSKGGDHTRINTQCLCHKCNTKKGSDGNGEQLLLFG